GAGDTVRRSAGRRKLCPRWRPSQTVGVAQHPHVVEGLSGAIVEKTAAAENDHPVISRVVGRSLEVTRGGRGPGGRQLSPHRTAALAIGVAEHPSVVKIRAARKKYTG